MATERSFPFEASILYVPCGPEGTPGDPSDAIPYESRCLVGFRPSDSASEKWVITEPDPLTGRNGAILYRSEMTIYSKSIGSFFVLVTCDPLGVKSLGVTAPSADKADELRRQCHDGDTLETLRKMLSKTEIAVVERLWKSKRGVLLDDLAEDDRCFRECVTRDAVLRKIKRIRQKIDALAELGITVSISKDKAAIDRLTK